MAPFTVFYVNFWYGPDINFNSVEEAVAYAKTKGFDAAIRGADGEAVGHWSIISGYRKF